MPPAPPAQQQPPPPSATASSQPSNLNPNPEPSPDPSQEQQQQEDSKQPPPPPPPPGPRAARLQALFASTVRHTLDKISRDNFAACFPTVAARAPGTLEFVQRQMVERLGGLWQVRSFIFFFFFFFFFAFYGC
jgi:kinetochore protein NNF1